MKDKVNIHVLAHIGLIKVPLKYDKDTINSLCDTNIVSEILY